MFARFSGRREKETAENGKKLCSYINKWGVFSGEINSNINAQMKLSALTSSSGDAQGEKWQNRYELITFP